MLALNLNQTTETTYNFIRVEGKHAIVRTTITEKVGFFSKVQTVYYEAARMDWQQNFVSYLASSDMNEIEHHFNLGVAAEGFDCGF